MEVTEASGNNYIYPMSQTFIFKSQHNQVLPTSNITRQWELCVEEHNDGCLAHKHMLPLIKCFYTSRNSMAASLKTISA